MRRILVTGDAGFVGTRVTARLAASETGATPLPLADPDGSRVDLVDAQAVDRAVAQAVPHAIIHLAAVAAPAEARKAPDLAWQVNVEGTRNLVRAMQRHAPGARLVFAGSSEAYGLSFNHGAPLDETAALRPTTTYGATKAVCDVMLAQLFHEGLDVVRFRPFNHTGAGQTDAYVVSAFARQVARIERGRQEPVLSVGNLEARRDFLNVEDVVSAYVAAATGTGAQAGAVYNLSTAEPVRISDILDILKSIAKRDFEVRTDPARYTPNAVPLASGSFARAERDFGWRPRIPFEQTVAEVLDYWRGEDSTGT